MICKTCDGAGAIPCPECASPYGINLRALRTGPFVYPPLCDVCDGVKSVQCPACLGKPIYTAEEGEGKLPTLKGGGPTRQNSESTTARLVLAIHYLLDGLGVDLTNKSAEIRFIKFLIDRDESAIKGKLTEIRERENPPDKRSKKIAPRSPKSRKEDLKLIKPFFVGLKLESIVNSIDDEIRSIEEGAS